MVTAAADPVEAIKATLTDGQVEVLDLLAEGLTGKEIAGRLGISDSGARQRIERVRRKFDGLGSNELARLWREHRAAASSDRSQHPCTNLSWQSSHLAADPILGEEPPRNRSSSDLEFSDAYVIDTSAPWAPRKDISLVPEVLDGENAVPARWMFVAGFAVLLAVLMLVLFAIGMAFVRTG
ncbi:response regulator transcription factor [Aurantiacibacter luteus]|uniref:HTH luxR-type domain-containing protein n=1 Tax=Aurantiacibacter luteus TaxID=1581420 RepID=A0A0G9MPE6_9SPHN|nr:LuxR C-terminal-related transcriptional regulator [Aurantiacibacter luteus]KLE32474.1 hypothetical protein AAW00_13715 [Aurantiacibacter luteus]